MKKLTRFHALKIYDWCRKRYGRGTKPYPVLEYRKPDYLNSEYSQGEYDYEDDTIYVNSQMHKTLEDLADTIIHEYVHYRYHAKSSYYQMDRDYDHDSHPLEKQAESIAKRDRKKCVQELKKYHKQFIL